MADRTIRTTVAGKRLYYLAIDGTDAQDAATFGALLEKNHRWRNLAKTFLSPAPDDPTRLVDPAHPYLPIRLFQKRGRRVAVVCPSGTDGKGLDRFWLEYQGETQDSLGTLYGRHAAAEISSRFTSQLILTPAIHVHENKRTGNPERHFADRQLPNPARHAPMARLLYVSSHGWMGGYMRGEILPKAPQAEPAEAREAFLPETPYFLVGSAAARGLGFHGPEWIVLAQCSTVNSSTWPLWVQVLLKSSPPVRGILAYEDASPAARPSARLAETFLAALEGGATMLDAWRTANRSLKWSAIVHRDALNDTLAGFGSFRPLRVARSPEEDTHYLGFLGAVPGFSRIALQGPPFTLRMEHTHGDGGWEILPDNLSGRAALLERNHQYGFLVEAPPGRHVLEARLTLIHLRRGKKQFLWREIFPVVSFPHPVDAEGHGTQELKLTPKKVRSSVGIIATADPIPSPEIRAGYSYFWIRAAIRTEDGWLRHDFKTKGLNYWQ